ncbi:hypothetical protein [Actinophytocola sp. KF-1]
MWTVVGLELHGVRRPVFYSNDQQRALTAAGSTESTVVADPSAFGPRPSGRLGGDGEHPVDQACRAELNAELAAYLAAGEEPLPPRCLQGFPLVRGAPDDGRR